MYYNLTENPTAKKIYNAIWRIWLALGLTEPSSKKLKTVSLSKKIKNHAENSKTSNNQ